MSTWNAFYVRADGVSDAASIIVRKEFPEVKFETKNDFLGVNLGENAFEAPELKLSAISARLKTDVIFLSFQSAVDAFQYYHWRNGDLVRRLVYGCFAEEGTWEHADGEAEPWEDEVFFHPKGLEWAIEYAPDETAKAELTEIWNKRLIKPGQTEPGLDSKSTAWAVAKYYQLPHF